jgi:AhpC/TSA antioxidant enzyme
MQLHRARSDFEEAGASLVLIGQATPRHAAQFRRRQGLQVPVLADKDRVSYKAAGAKVAGVTDLFGPKVIAKGALTGVRNKTIQTRTIGDTAQLGGALVVLPDGSIPWSHMSSDAGDNAPPEEILAAVRKVIA